MKAKDLMVGEWVKRIGDSTPRRIVEIDVLAEEIRGDDDYWVNTDNLEPVPLTEDILKKNFFKAESYKLWTQKHTFYTRGENGRSVRVDFKEGGLHSIMVYGFLLIIESYRISSVHEFQHALRLGDVGFDIEL